QAERRVEQEVDLVRQISSVIGERGGVTLQRLDLLLDRCCRLLALAAGLMEAGQPDDAEQALASHRQKLTLAADTLDHRLQVLRFALDDAARAEDLVRNAVNLIARGFQHLRQAIDE